MLPGVGLHLEHFFMWPPKQVPFLTYLNFSLSPCLKEVMFKSCIAALIVLILYHIFGDPVLDMISHETGLILYNGGHSKGDKA